MSRGTSQGLRLSDLVRSVRDLVPTGRGAGRLVTLEHVPPDRLALSDWGDARTLRTTGLRFSEGDLLFGALRPEHRKVIRAPFRGICSAEFLVLRPLDSERAGLAFAALSAPTTIARVARRATGTRMPRIKWRDLMALELPRPNPTTAAVIDRLARLFDERLSLLRMQQARRAALLVDLGDSGTTPRGPKLGEVASLRIALTPAAQLPPESRLYGVADLPSRGLAVALPSPGAPSSRKRPVRAGDVLVSTLRPESRKAGLCPEDGYASTEIAALDVAPRWRDVALAAVRSPRNWASWQAVASGTSLPRFKPRYLLETRLALTESELRARAPALRAAAEGLHADQRLEGWLLATRDRLLPALLSGESAPHPDQLDAAAAALGAGYTRGPRRT